MEKKTFAQLREQRLTANEKLGDIYVKAANRELNDEEKMQVINLTREIEMCEREMTGINLDVTNQEANASREKANIAKSFRSLLSEASKTGQKREILLFPTDSNVKGNITASGAIELTIHEMIPTLHEGLGLPQGLGIVTGVEGNELWPVSVNDVEMVGQVELMDTTRNVFAVAGRMEYTDSLSRVKMTRTPAVMSIDDDEKTAKQDTVYFGADTILYRGIKRNLVDSLWKVDAGKRLKDLQGDPVTEYRRKAAEAAAKAAAEAEKNDPNAAGRDRGPGGRPGAAGGKDPLPEGGKPKDAEAPPAGGASSEEEAKKKAAADSTAAAAAAMDTTRLSFIWAVNHVKLYRDDIQMSCDSLAYGDLDSLVRLYRDPLVFNEGNRQYAADSIYVVIKDKKADRARLMSNAFITTQEDTLCYDQIKGTEMMAYFDSTRTLRRFDALGGATALFFLTENDALATVNKVESKMLYALFDKGNLDKIYYFDNAKNDAYPVVQLPKDERYMKGFRWEPERKPRGRRDITPLIPRPSQRTSYLARPHAQFKETNVYFPGHINKIYKDIAYRDSMAVVKARQPKEKPVVKTPVDTTAVSPVDTTTTPVDTSAAPAVLSPADETLREALDSLAATPQRELKDTPPVAKDTTAVMPPPVQEKEAEVLDPQVQKKEAERAAKEAEKARKAQEKAAKEAEKARIEAEKKAQKEAKWAEQDKKYQEKQAAKEQKRLEKERKQKLRALQKLEKKAQKERRIYERYLEKERARAEKKAAREAEKARKQAEKEAGGAEETDNQKQ